MKRQFYVLFLLLSFVLLTAAQTERKISETEAALRKYVEYLASDALGGRRTGEPGAAAAAKYVADQFAEAGLTPGYRPKGGNAGYLQPFRYVTGVEMAKTGNFVDLEFTKGGKRVKADRAMAASPVGFSPGGSVKGARIVFAGYGIVSEDPKFDDYSFDGGVLDARGKVVLAFDGVPDNDNPHNAFARYDARTKALIAKGKGAVGILLISREENFADEKLALLKYDQTLGEAAIPTFVISRKTAENLLGIDAAALTTIEGLIAARANSGAKTNVGFRDTDPVISFSVNLTKKLAPANNVIGILPGKDPALKGEAIVIGAHYDHLGYGGQGSLAANSTDIHHGADDNASGTAAVIELAHRFVYAANNKRTIIFISFGGEEEGLIGSKAYVNDPVWPIDKTIAMINLDMVGRLNKYKLNIGGIGTASEFRALVEMANPQVRAEPVFPTTATVVALPPPRPLFELQLNEDGFGPSDHSSFYGKKVPVLFFFTGTHSDYHKPSDTADKINYPGEAIIVDYVERIATEIDRNATRPTYEVAKSSGTAGRAAFNVSLGTIPSYVESTDGLGIDGVRDGSPADKAGLKGGDKIIRLAGKDVRNISDYMFVLGLMKAGEEYEIVVKRGDETVTLKIIPEKR